ncbi:hypothetical protein CDAR_500991 [Caerostris darwini]|uniref:Uncharacterized protein n=1 Tax=Caerostris darwini TaxID=1538125 RepID=A0AAV4PL44_9ARAC|nr:hypothetical protein CDAR_500991 [Caerostris darwini]
MYSARSDFEMPFSFVFEEEHSQVMLFKTKLPSDFEDRMGLVEGRIRKPTGEAKLRTLMFELEMDMINL